MRILFVNTGLRPPGGGEGLAAWMLQALQEDHELTLLTWDEPDFEAVDRFFGTRLEPERIARRVVPARVRRLVDALPNPAALLRNLTLFRYAKKLADGYDLVISNNNESDLGRRGIQYVHFPWAYLPRPPEDMRWYHVHPALVTLYQRFCIRMADFSFERARSNLTLANSRWTAERIRERHGIQARVLYPPVAGDFPEVPWSERERGFVCIGRFSPEKRLERVIEILSRVRAAGEDVHLHVVGTPQQDSYARRIRSLIEEEREWVTLNAGVSRHELSELISRHRYGIHAMEEEHFGMAVAELVRGGCITFVPAGGGQVEIVGGEERLLFRSVPEAVEKILAVLGDPEGAAELRRHLEPRGALFTSGRFMQDFRRIVEEFR